MRVTWGGDTGQVHQVRFVHLKFANLEYGTSLTIVWICAALAEGETLSTY